MSQEIFKGIVKLQSKEQFEQLKTNGSITINEKTIVYSPTDTQYVIPDTTEQDIQNLQNNKVDKIEGKGLSTNDYTTEEKNKLANIESGAQVNTVISVAGKTGNIILSKNDVGLNNVDNTSDLDKPISTVQQNALNNKVDKVEGKQLSTNDYTTEEKNKLAGIEAGAQVNPTSLSQLADDSTHRLVTDTEKAIWNAKAEVSQIPTNNNQLTNGAGYATTSEVNNAVNTKTTVNVNNQIQSTLNFTSDPQTQIDALANKGIGIELSSIEGTLTSEQFNTLDSDPNNYIKFLNTRIDSEWSHDYYYIYRLYVKSQNYSYYMNVGHYDFKGGRVERLRYIYVNRNTLEYTADSLNPYHVGAIYISVDNTSPASIYGGTWEALPEGYTLWTTTTAGEGGQTIEAGLPNIEGNVSSVWNSTTFDNTSTYEGALSLGEQVTIGSQGGSGYKDYLNSLGFDASQANEIYGNSETVQPPAIKVYAWKRIS